MVNIVRPGGGTPQQGRGSINESLAATAGSGAGAIGSAVESAGRALSQVDVTQPMAGMGRVIESESKKYFAETQAAHQTAMLSNSMTDATLAFTSAQQQRLATVTDEKGNPTFMNLTSDIGTLGKDTIKNISANISDPKVAAAFKAKFTDYVTKQQVSSMKVARHQQVGFSRSSLDRGLGALLQQGSTDSVSNLEGYIGQGMANLNDALSTGAISPEEHAKKSSDFAETMRIASYENTITSSPVDATALLQSSAGGLGISEQAKADLDATLEAKKGSDQIAEIKAKAALEVDNKNQQAQLGNDISTRIEADAIREDDFLKQKKNLDPATFSTLKRQFKSAAAKRAKTRVVMDGISNAISKGLPTSAVTPTNINKHYGAMVDSRSAQLGRKLSLADKAQLANVYKDADVPAFAQEVGFSLLHGDLDAAADAVSAYTMVRDSGTLALKHSSWKERQHTQVAEYAELLSERGGMSLGKAVEMARERIMSAGEPEHKARASEFRKMKGFKGKDLEAMAADTLGAEGFFGRNKPVSGDSQHTFASLVRQNYIESGDMETAKNTAKYQMSLTHGLSSFNGGEEYAYAAPEVIYKGHDMVKMRAQFENDALQYLPKGFNSANIKLQSDVKTRGRKVGGKDIVTYGVMAKQEIAPGVEEWAPVVLPSGQLFRWYPDLKAISSEGVAEDTAEQQRQLDIAESDHKNRDVRPESKAIFRRGRPVGIKQDDNE